MNSIENWQETSSGTKYSVSFLNPTFDKAASVFKYKITITDSQDQEVFETSKTIGELMVLFEALTSESRIRLFTSTNTVEFADDTEYDDYISFKPVLKEAFQEILNRRDTRVDHLLQNFCKDIPQSFDEFFPVLLTGRNQISESLNMGDLLFDEEHQLYLACTENSSALARAGRVWSLIKAETNGILRAFRLSKGALMPSFEKLLKREYEVRCGACLYHSGSKTIYVGFSDGKVCYFKLNGVEERDTKAEFKSIIDEPILGFQFLTRDTCEFITFSENNIKILNATCKVIGGGSLRKRLDSAYLTALGADSSKKTIFLGTSKGSVLIYSYSKSGSEYSLKFLTEVEVKEEIAIECIQIQAGVLIVGCGLKIHIYSYEATSKEEINLKELNKYSFDKSQTKDFTGDEIITQVALIKNKRILVGTLSNGLLVFWSTDFGTIIGAVKAHDDSIIRLSVDEKTESITTAGWDTQIKVWKYGLREDPKLNSVPETSLPEFKN